MVLLKRRLIWWYGVMVKKELCRRAMVLRTVTDRVMLIALISEEEVIG